MSVKQILPGLYQITSNYLFNVFLIDSGELILIDVGLPTNTKVIQKAVQAIGRQMTDVRHILVTHCHRGHAGSLTAVKQITGAPAYMHPIAAAAVRIGKTRRDYAKPVPSLINKLGSLVTLTTRSLLAEIFMKEAPSSICSLNC